MSKTKLLIIFICLSISYGYAHESNKAFFSVAKKAAAVEIEAEFPWTLRSALFDFSPSLNETKDQQKFDDALFKYVERNLLVFGKEGNLSKLQGIEKVKRKGHSHGVDYIFVFENKGISKIKNTLMFNFNKDQINYHTASGESFKTSQTHKSFELPESQSFAYIYLIFAIGIISSLIYSEFKFQKNK